MKLKLALVCVEQLVQRCVKLLIGLRGWGDCIYAKENNKM